MEKPIMDQPQEEFVAPKSIPSRDISGERSRPASKPESRSSDE